MTAPKLCVGLAILLAGCNEIPQLDQQRRELEKKAITLQAEIEAVNAHILGVQASTEKTLAGTTVSAVSSAYDLVLKDTEVQVAELAQRLEAAESKLASVRQAIDEHQQKFQRP